MVGSYDANMLSDMLPAYYARLFPQNLLCRWLSCGGAPQPLCNRELSFTLADDVYMRYLSINNQKDLQTLLQKKCPYKLDIGAVYNTKPSTGRHNAVVLSRELVFDIDLTDYDEIRTCCQEARVCAKCWKFMAIACQILDRALREDFGFESVVWVFSGRRGVHAWVSDVAARALDGPARAALADYLQLLVGGDSHHKKVHLPTEHLHSSIKRALTVIDKYFEELLEDQQFLSTTERLNKFLKLIPEETLRAQTDEVLSNMHHSSVDRWNTFVHKYDAYCRDNITVGRKLKYLVEEIKLQYSYPRLDANVTRGFNHLLKSPFSIHPKTGKVSIVFKASHVRDMKLEHVPAIYTLLDDSSPDNALHVANMKESVKHFQEVVFALEKAEAARRRNDANTSIDF